MILELLNNASFLISGLAFLGMFLLFSDSLLLRFNLITFLKSLGFAILTISSAINLINHSYIPFTIWSFTLAFFLLFIAFIIDPLSKLKFLAPLPIIFIVLAKGNLLPFGMGLFISMAIFQLVYVTKHRDLIPLGVGFALISVTEYLYFLEGVENFKHVSAAVVIPYILAALDIFASFILIYWIWPYVSLRFPNLLKFRH